MRLFILFFISLPVFAQAPFIDYMISTTPVTQDICLEDAHSALTKQGFSVTTSTGSSERVGKKGTFKAVIACIDQDTDGFVEITVFIIAGSSYKTAATFNRALVEAWEKP